MGRRLPASCLGPILLFDAGFDTRILRSFADGRGLLNIAIHGIANLQKQTAVAGTNPLSCLGGEIKNGTLLFKEYDGQKWVWSEDVKSIPTNEVAYNLGGRTNFTFDEIFSNYDWVANRGYENLSSWVEAAAQAANDENEPYFTVQDAPAPMSPASSGMADANRADQR